MAVEFTQHHLIGENAEFGRGGGVSRNNRGQGFLPAFRDREDGRVTLACFADGRPSPMHLFDGVPAAWVCARDRHGAVVAIKPSIVSGFVRDGRFYTRAEVAALV